MRATVRPEKLREALTAKLLAAAMALHKLRDADKLELNQHWDPQNIVVEFLNAARGVVPIAETFLGERPFRRWNDAWEKARLPESDRSALWKQMWDSRRLQEHGEGAGLIHTQLLVDDRNLLQVNRSVVHLGMAPTKTEMFKGSVRFAAYPDRPVSEVCAEYLEMCQQFVDDFLREQAQLIP
jgi:hypothetical protein